VAALYEQGRVRHVGHFPALEDQLVAFGQDGRSPDRVDALVWAIADLVRDAGRGPRVRSF
jgi:phage terminase large subunit-like protein